MKKILFLFIFVLTSANAFAAPPKEIPKDRYLVQNLQNPYDVNAKFLDKGEKVYIKHCAICHTVTGEEPSYHSLQAMGKHHTPGDYVWVVTYGLDHTMGPGVMPPWEKELSLEERWAVVSYIQEKLAK